MKTDYDIILESITNNPYEFFKEFFAKYILRIIETKTILLKQKEFEDISFIDNEYGFNGTHLFTLKYETYTINFVLEEGNLHIYGESYPDNSNNIEIKEVIEKVEWFKIENIFSAGWDDSLIDKVFLVQDKCIKLFGGSIE